jgi:hypothetical protein
VSEDIVAAVGADVGDPAEAQRRQWRGPVDFDLAMPEGHTAGGHAGMVASDFDMPVTAAAMSAVPDTG